MNVVRVSLGSGGDRTSSTEGQRHLQRRGLVRPWGSLFRSEEQKAERRQQAGGQGLGRSGGPYKGQSGHWDLRERPGLEEMALGEQVWRRPALKGQMEAREAAGNRRHSSSPYMGWASMGGRQERTRRSSGPSSRGSLRQHDLSKSAFRKLEEGGASQCHGSFYN